MAGEHDQDVGSGWKADPQEAADQGRFGT